MTLVETVFAMGVLLMCALLFSATFPVATNTRAKVDLRSKAVSLASRQLEAARDAGYNALVSYAGLYSRGLIESSPNTSPYSITNISYNSGQTIANTLPQGTGTMSVTVESIELLRITVTVNWVERGTPQSTTLSTLLTFIN